MTSSHDTRSLPLSRSAVLCFAFCWFPVAGLIFGVVAFAATGRSGDRRGRPVAITGLLLSAAFFVLPIYALIPWWNAR